MATAMVRGMGMSNSMPEARTAMHSVRHSTISRRVRAATAPLAIILTLLPAGAYTQPTAAGERSGRAVSVVPRVSLTETLTDNVSLAPSGGQSDQITEIRPGIQINMNGARVKGYLDYALSSIFYAQNSSARRTEHALSAFATLEAVQDWAFLDVGGFITQEQVSAFGTPSVDSTAINANRTEVSSYRISPYVRGEIGDIASYEARYSQSETNSSAARSSDVSTVNANLNLAGRSVIRNLGWSADATRQKTDFEAGRATEADRLTIGLSYYITPQLNLTAKGGREAHNYTTLDKQSHGTSGFGVNWMPSQTTRLSAFRDRRSFANLHSVSFERRTARTVWKFSDSKEVSVTPNQTVLGSRGSIFDLLFAQFESIEPNEAARADLVSAFLKTNALDPNVIVIDSFLKSAAALQRRQDLSFALLGVRDTLTVRVTRSESSRLDTLSRGVDDLTASERVRQRGVSVNFTHRLTPAYSLGVLLSQQKTTGESRLQESRLRFINASVTGQVGKNATVSVSARHTVSRGTSPYSENAITGNLTVRF